jgi:cobyrinic acid a,c-diamide synthase
LNNVPRLIVSGLRGGSGKTLLSLGLARALTQDGFCLKAFKKGPDYIDAAWLGLAAGRSAANLDLFFLPPERLLFLFSRALSPDGGEGAANFALIEGNRGLFDGRDPEGSCSTAALARVLRSPVLLSLDCTKMTRTAAAVVAGVNAFEPDLPPLGIVLNKTGSERHASRVRRAVEHYCPTPVLGALPRLKENPLPERHMGLALDTEEAGQLARVERLLDTLAEIVRDNLDLKRLLLLAASAPALPPAEDFRPPAVTPAVPSRIGYVKDAALWFYYEENLEALRRAGAELVRLSLLDDRNWPELDGLYLGGGFPEDFAARLSVSPKLALLKDCARQGMPVYAECGGFLLLAHSLEREGQSHPMAGLFPVRAFFHERPQGLGYVEASAVLPNPFHPVGTPFTGHEFHYTRCVPLAEAEPEPVLRLLCGSGIGGGVDGLTYKNVFACYTHIFAPAVPHWAGRFTAAAESFARRKHAKPRMESPGRQRGALSAL